MTTRAQFTTFGAGDGCPGNLKFQYAELLSSSWTDYGNVPTALPGVFYEAEFALFVANDYKLRMKVTYDGSDYFSNTIQTVKILVVGESPSEGQWVVFRDVGGRREYLDSSDGWTVSEKAARKVGHESVALDLAATHGGQAAKKRLAFTGLA